LPKYTGSCICGSISFVVSMDPSEILSCPCSYCAKRALEFAVVEASQIELNQTNINRMNNTMVLLYLGIYSVKGVELRQWPLSAQKTAPKK
jgi:hypothetical protein